MKVTELQELFTANTTDGQTDYEAIAKSVNEATNTVRDNALNKYKETASKELAPEIQNAFIKQYEFENVDQFKAFVTNSKATSNELTEKTTRLEQELSKYEETYKGLETKYNELNSKYTGETRKSLAKSLGVKEDMVDYAMFEANKSVTEEVNFEEALKGLIESKPTLVSEETRVKVGTKKTETGDGEAKSYADVFAELKKSGRI